MQYTVRRSWQEDGLGDEDLACFSQNKKNARMSACNSADGTVYEVYVGGEGGGGAAGRLKPSRLCLLYT